MKNNDEELNLITEKIIGSAFNVSNKLGFGFLEKVYENALCIELTKTGLNFVSQKPLDVYYDNFLVGEYYADIYVENEIIVELKVSKNLDENHQAQLMNYLKASNKRIGLLINFGKSKIEIKRMLNGF
jgi:GxxExxY protein